ncbi:MAG: FecR domain-containing protein, partial [Rubripirellula sp.]
MLLTEDCRWNDAQVLAEGQRLNGRLKLSRGLAVLRFDGGAELILRGDTDLQLLSPGEAMLHRGDVVVRASDEAAGFRLLTPASELIDLGTEFSVRVADAGATTLNVLDGEVSVRPLRSTDAIPQVLPAGRAVMVEDAESAPREVALTPERFDSVVEDVNPVGRADLMYAYEGFFYDESEISLSDSHRGKGWVGPWRQRTEVEGFRANEDVSDVLDIVHGKMNVTWPVPGGEDGMMRLPAGKTFRIREMTQPIDLSTDGIYYFSFMVREPDYGNRPRRAKPQEGIRLTFRGSGDYYGEALSFGISPDLHPQIRTGRGVGFFSAVDAPSDQTTLWIGKVIARANGEDEVSFRIFSESDGLTYAEPSAWHVVSKGLDLSAKLNLTVLTSQGTAARIVDELRIGPTWRSVTPLREVE